jgi:glutamyl-Q tRNA(Asp) synthetase
MSIASTKPYIGRFAPSPTGPLHFGSLVAAVASYCDAKSHDGKWLLRMEDLDKPRTVKGAADDILRALAAFGFKWDGDGSNNKIMYQSTRDAAYADALATLQKQAVIYPCTCTRKEITDSATSSGIEGVIYPRTCHPKTCLNHPSSTSSIHAAYRAIVVDENISFIDAIQGNITQNLARDIGDFIVKRADGLLAYQLAVVVDDAAQGVTHIVRGADLINSTTRQVYLQQLLGYTTPHYAHVPVASNLAGEKLSKQTLAKPIDSRLASQFIFEALSFLGQMPPTKIKNASLEESWRWAISNWNIANVPKHRQICRIE